MLKLILILYTHAAPLPLSLLLVPAALRVFSSGEGLQEAMEWIVEQINTGKDEAKA